MRSILVLGVGIGVGGGAALVALALVAALIAVPGLPLVGLVAGLAMAKWLPWSWYGRQAKAGLRVGTLACGLAGAGLLAVLLTTGPRSATTLAARSRLGGLMLGGVVHPIAFVGWVGVDVLLCLGATVLGVTVAVLVCVVFAVGKSAHVVTAITEARDAALALQRARAQSAPLPGFALPTAPPASGLWHATAVPLGEAPAAASILPPPPAPNSQRMSTTARPLGSELTQDQREALLAWGRTDSGPIEPAEESGFDDMESEPWPEEEEPPAASPDSSYLNSSKPAKRRRKPQHTRDWLC